MLMKTPNLIDFPSLTVPHRDSRVYPVGKIKNSENVLVPPFGIKRECLLLFLPLKLTWIKEGKILPQGATNFHSVGLREKVQSVLPCAQAFFSLADGSDICRECCSYSPRSRLSKLESLKANHRSSCSLNRTGLCACLPWGSWPTKTHISLSFPFAHSYILHSCCFRKWTLARLRDLLRYILPILDI